jgi:chemotaxis protein MotB
VSVSLLSGCTNWRQRYEYLNVEHANTQGRLKTTEQEKNELAAKVAQDQATIDELTKQIEQMGKTPAAATGFEGMNVSFSKEAGTITVTLPESILFASGQAALKSASVQQLDKVASVIKEKYAGRMIDVVGNTDNVPITKSHWTDNLELSTERANTVARYLMKQGIPAADVRSVGCGDTRPVADNTSAAGRAKNRRVEIVVHVRSAA